ncbi:MAG: hypothetical protein ACTHQM_26385 [Thermoanaerobaculia bacterium]
MSARSILPQSVYRRAKEPNQLSNELKLIALEWALYFAVTGTHTATELGKQLRVDAEDRNRALARLLELGLIAEQELHPADYVRALAAAGDPQEKTLREFLIAASQSSDVVEATPRPQLHDVKDFATATLQRVVPPRPAKVAPPLAFTPLPSPNDRKENRMSGSRKLSLRALMNLIESQAGSREAGQLDIYRVFVRVDTSLLKRSGIETLRFTEDRLVSDPELQQAIVRSVKKTLGVDCPESLWVA